MIRTPDQKARSGRYRKYIVWMVLQASLCSCSTIGSMQDRAESINKASAGYAASATLYNVLRAANAEPLQFVSLTGVTGHNTATASLGLPTIVVGAGQTAAQRLFLFGPNTIGGSEANDFNISVVDDPQSFAALLRPIDPATIGFFIDQGYEQAKMLFLFISRIRVYDAAGKTLIHDYYQDILQGHGEIDPAYKANFYDPLDGYINAGLSVRVDPTYVPQPGKSGTAQLCFDERWMDPKPTPGSDALGRRLSCAAALSPAAEKRTASSDAAKAGSTRTKASAPPGTVRLEISTSSSGQPQETKPDYTFTDRDGNLVQLQTRSLIGAYRFLGELARIDENLTPGQIKAAQLGDLLTGDQAYDLIHLTHAGTGCWTSVSFEGRYWCISNDAFGTKRVFAILHQLFELYASPNNQPATQTVRVTQ